MSSKTNYDESSHILQDKIRANSAQHNAASAGRVSTVSLPQIHLADLLMRTITNNHSR